MKVALFVTLFVACAFAQGPFTNAQLRLIVDDFSVNTGQNAVVVLQNDLLSGAPLVDQSSSNSAGCSGLVGCARDMEMRVFTGLNGRTFESEIFSVPETGYFDGEWAIANPKTSTALATNQYDGNDNTFDLDITGLGGVDVTDGGNTEFFFFSAVSDIEITYTIDLYDIDGDICELNIDLPSTLGDYDYEETFYEFDLDEFSDACDMTNIGAIEISLPSQDAVDAIVRLVAFVGNPPATPNPSPSRTPSSTPIPPPEECHCHCPIFTCALIFDPDDDENNAYYFDDDDEGEIVGSNGTLFYYDFETGSSATMLGVSALVAVVLALVL